MFTAPALLSFMWNSGVVVATTPLLHCSNCSHMTVLGTVTWNSGAIGNRGDCSNYSALFHAWELAQ